MKTLILILLFGFMASSLAQPPLLSIELKHRTADELVPMLRPLAGDGATVVGSGRHLFLRAEPARLEELQLAVRRLDTRARQLSISVYQGSEADLLRYAEDRLDLHTTRDRRAATQNIKVLEGQRAGISIGRSLPRLHTGTAIGPTGWYGYQGTHYRDTEQGFYVRAWTHGDRVNLELSTFDEQIGSHGEEIETRGASTRLTGRIGEWLSVGGHAQGINLQKRRPILRRGTHSRDEWNIYVKVDPLDPDR